MLFFVFEEKEGLLTSLHSNYVINGRARMTIFSPGGNIDTFERGPDQIVFIPTFSLHRKDR